MPKSNGWRAVRGGSPKWIVAVALSVLWIFVVYLGHYTVHKPFTASIILAILDRLADLTIWTGLLLLATALGHRLLTRLTYHSLLEQLTFAAGLGLGLLSLLTLALGLLGLLQRWLFCGLAALGYLVLFPQVRSIVQRLRRTQRSSFPTRLDRFLAAYLIIVLSLSLLTTLAPPIAWDSQVYHLTGPKLFIGRGKIVGGTDIPYLGFPSLLEMLFLVGMLLKGDIVSKLIHFGYSLLAIGLLYSFVRRFLQPRIPRLAPAIYLSAPTLVLVSTWAYVDLGLAFYSLAAFYSLITWIDSREASWLVLSGILSGLALGVKYTALVMPLSLGLIVILESRKSRTKRMVRNLLTFASTTTVVACPWYLRNVALTGNPLYPFVFGGTYWDEFRAWWFGRWGTGLLSQPLRLLLAPWEMTILGIEGKVGYAATLGPVFLVCLPFLTFIFLRRNSQRRGPPIIAYALLVCGANYLFWLYGVAQSALLQQTRLLIPIFPLLAILASIAVEELATWDMEGFSLQRFVLMVLAITLSLNAFSFLLSFVAYSPMPYILGVETRQEYLNRHLGDYYQAISYINKDLPASSRVLFLWEPRSYYCQRDCWPDAILDRFKHLAYKYSDAEGIADYLRTQGISHVLLHKAGFEHILAAKFDPILPTDVGMLETLQEEYLEPLGDISDSYVVYRVR
jgi:hypothetical protein